jgi:hypothetical protein
VADHDARKRKRRRSETRALTRYCADRLSLWWLCGQPACARAKSCRGDVEACSGLLLAWFEAMQEQLDDAPTFADMEARIESPREMRLYRGWRDMLDRAEEEAKTPPAETAILREQLKRQILALARTMAAKP